MTANLRDYPLTAGTRRFLSEAAFGHLIEGEVVAGSGRTMPVIEPGTGREFAQAAAGDAADVDRAVRSARAAFDDGRWRHLPPAEREKRLRRLATLLEE